MTLLLGFPAWSITVSKLEPNEVTHKLFIPPYKKTDYSWQADGIYKKITSHTVCRVIVSCSGTYGLINAIIHKRSHSKNAIGDFFYWYLVIH